MRVASNGSIAATWSRLTVNPQKALRIETRLEFVHAEIHEVSASARVDGDVVVVGLESVDVVDRDWNDPSSIAHEDP
jgi:hypothetical protein